MAPTLPEVLADLGEAGHLEIEVHPLFLAGGSHTGVDLPRLVDEATRRLPGLRVTLGAPLLESTSIRAALVAALSDAGSAGN
jgi:sirohydrochlorin ferrochelatase